MSSTTPIRIGTDLDHIRFVLDKAKIHNDLLYRIALDPTMVEGGEHVPGDIFNGMLDCIHSIKELAEDLENRIAGSIMKIVNDQNKETT